LSNKIHFIGIGAHKSGTSWLYERLREIDDFHLPPIKELHYFDKKYKLKNIHYFNRLESFHSLFFSLYHCARNYSNLSWFFKWFYKTYSDSWYRSLFSSKKIQGEITPAYSTLNEYEIERLKSIANPEKILLIIRNPIQRVWSHYQYFCQRGKIRHKNNTEDIKEFILSDVQTSRSDYLKIIEKYRSFFDDKNIYIMFYDSILEQPEALITDLLKVFGIEKHQISNCNYNKINNSSKSIKVSKNISKFIAKLYAKDISTLAEKIGSYCKIWNNENIKKSELWNIKSLKQISYD